MIFNTASTSTSAELDPTSGSIAEATVVEPAGGCADVDGPLALADTARAPPPKILDMITEDAHRLLLQQVGPARQQKCATMVPASGGSRRTHFIGAAERDRLTVCAQRSPL